MMLQPLNISSQDILDKLDFTKLDGWNAQKGMAPPTRLPTDKYGKSLNDARVAAVIILLYEEQGRIKFPLILRNVYEGVHSNQIGLPGGKVEENDKDLAATAIRECQEEIAAKPDDIQILGQLSELYIPPSNFLVYPFVGFYHNHANFIPCDLEVQQIIHVTLNDFIQLEKQSDVMEGSDGAKQDVPVYLLENEFKLWGATAMMLNEFKLFVRKSLNL